MALKPEARIDWILARLESDEPLDAHGPAGATEMDRAELAREVADCRQMWRALDELNEGIESETASPGARSVFQAHLAEAMARQRAGAASRSRRPGILGWAPSRQYVRLAAAAALLVIAAVTLWRQVTRLEKVVPAEEGTTGSAGPVSRSASSRLGAVLAPAAVNRTETLRNLGRVLVSDPNPNVRLAALGVLSERFAESGLEGRVAEALAGESDPLVRLELIRAIGEHHLVQDGEVLPRLERDPRLDDVAREEIARVMERLGS